jgi:hypothetical protein
VQASAKDSDAETEQPYKAPHEFNQHDDAMTRAPEVYVLTADMLTDGGIDQTEFQTKDLEALSTNNNGTEYTYESIELDETVAESGATGEAAKTMTIERLIAAVSLSDLIIETTAQTDTEDMLFAPSSNYGKPLSSQTDRIVELVLPTFPEDFAVHPSVKLAVTKIEDSAKKLAELIEDVDMASNTETTKAFNEVLEKVTETTVKKGLEKDTNAATETTEAELQEELEELFIKLFETAGLDYTPELGESLTHLVIKWNLAAEIKKPKNSEGFDELPQISDTNEAIKQFLVGISNFRQAMLHASEIGKSALHLSNFNLAA